jgi:hypothetical protein
MIVSPVARMANYNMCVYFFSCTCWVTLPCAPHLIICAEINGGRVTEKCVPDCFYGKTAELPSLKNVVVNCVGLTIYGNL